MPTALLRYCGEPGCPELVASGRCSAHARVYDTRRGTACNRGYDARWRRLRRRFIHRLIALGIGPLCGARLPGAPETAHSRCVADHRVVAGAVVDHIVPHRGDERRLYDTLNLQFLCKACHDRKTATEDGGFGR